MEYHTVVCIIYQAVMFLRWVLICFIPANDGSLAALGINLESLYILLTVSFKLLIFLLLTLYRIFGLTTLCYLKHVIRHTCIVALQK